MTVDDFSRVRVLIGTTDRSVDLLRLVREKPIVRRSDVYIASSTERAGIGRGYNEFVSSKAGPIERLFGKGAYRINVSDRIDAGSSWQLGFFLAHALQVANRLAHDNLDHETVVWTTGTVRNEDLSVGEIGYLGKKIALSLERLHVEAKAGKRVLVAYPAVNAAEVDAELRRSIQNAGATIIEVDNGRQLLRELGLPPVGALAAVANRAWEGTPFRNLEPFETRHREIFFGRGRAREEALERLRRSAAQGFAFLLVHGRSGAGKSSLARAGLLGDIKAHASEAGVWLDCIITPQRSAETPLLSLVKALHASLPQISSSFTPDYLLESARARSPEGVEAICAAIAAAGSGAACKLILLIDQLEELLLWTRERTDSQALNDREAFGDLVAGLSRSGVVWTIATLRSDLLGSLDDSPALSRLANDDNTYRLDRPTRMEIREIVLRPVAAARLTLEGADLSGLPFAEVLIDKASASPDSLPLLQFVLSRLFEIEGRTGRLTYAMYTRLKGLEGAIGRLAEDTVQALVREGLPTQAIEQLILSLGRYDRDLTTITARWANIPKEELRDQAQIMEALAKARLLVLDEGGRARVAHEAVLTHWPRAKTLFETAARDLDLRDLLEPDAESWNSRGRDPAFLMPAGRRLTEAADLLSAKRVLLSEAARRFVAASLEEARKTVDAENARLQAEALKERRWRRRAVAAGVVLAGLTAIAVWFATDAREQAIIATEQTKVANDKTKEASDSARESDEQRQAAQAAEQKARDSAEEASFREAAARTLLEIQSSPEQGLETAIRAFKQNIVSGKPLLTELYSASWKALDVAREVKWLRKSRPWLTNVTAIVPSPDGSRILVATASGIHVMDLDGRQLVAPISGGEQINTESKGAAWHPSGERFIVAQGLGQGLRLYNADGTFVRTLLSRSGVDITSCVFLDENQVAAGTSDGNLIILSLSGDIISEKRLSTTSAIAGVAKFDNLVVGAEAAARNEDPREVNVDDSTVGNVDAAPEQTIEAMPTLVPPGARCLVKGPNNSDVLAVCGSEGRVDLWERSGSANSTYFFKHKTTIQAHVGKVNTIAFHPAGTFIATGGDDGLIRFFLLNGQAVQSPLRRSGGIEPIEALSFVDNGNKLLSQCDGGLCLWDVQDLNVSESIDHYPDFSVEDSRTGGFFTGDNDGEGGWKIRFVSPSGDSRLILSATSGKLRALKYAEAMNQLAYVTLDKISMVDVATGSIIWSVDATEADHVCLAFAKDNRLLGLVTSQASSGSASNPGSADLRTEIHFVVLDANTGEKRGEAKRQGQSPIGDIIGVLDSSNPLFITVTNNGILEEWTSDLSVLKTSSLLEDTGRFATSRARLFASRSGLLGVAVGSSIGLFDTKLNPQQSLRKLDKTIDALAISPDDQFYAIIAHSSRIGAGSEPTVMRVYDMRGGLIAERTLFKDSSSDAPLYFGDSIIETLQSDGLISWSMGPDSLLKAAEKRLVYYRNQQKRLELERLADKAFKEHRYRDAIKLFQEAIDIDPINSDQHALLGNSFVFGAETAGDWEAADRAYSAGIAVQPYDSILFLQRGKERFRAGRFAEAEEDFSSGLKHHQFFLPVVRVIAGFLGLNKGIHNLSITLVMQGAGEFHLRRAMARFAQKKWTSVISDINAIQQVNLDVDKYQKKYWPEAYKGEPRELLPIYLHYRGRAAFHLGRYEDAYRDLRSAADRMRHDDVEYAYDDLELPNSAGVREATRGDMLAVAAQAAQLSGNVQSATDALAEARSAFAAAISRAPNSQIWNEALAALPQ